MVFARRALPRRIAFCFHALDLETREALADCVMSLRDLGYEAADLDTYLSAASDARLFTVTFDDNFRSWHQSLRDFDRLGIRATFFTNTLPFRDVASAQDIADFSRRIQASAPVEPLSQRELREISREGHAIAAHSHSHHVLAQMPRHLWDLEIRQNKEILEDITGSAVTTLSWPYGLPRHFSEDLAAYCRSVGLTQLFGATPGLAHQELSEWRHIPRNYWRPDRTSRQNLTDIAIDGRHFTRLTGRSAIG